MGIDNTMYFLLGLIFTFAYLLFTSWILFLLAKKFKVSGLTYKKSLIISAITSVAGFIFLFIIGSVPLMFLNL